MNENDFSWTLALFLTGSFVAIMMGVIVIAWQVFATWRARMSVAREEAYRRLAGESAEAMNRTAEQLERTTAELKQLRKHTAELERMLKEVG